MELACYLRQLWRRIGPLRHRNETGASLVEYALLIGLIALVCIAAVAFFGNRTGSSFSRTGSSVGNAGN